MVNVQMSRKRKAKSDHNGLELLYERERERERERVTKSRVEETKKYTFGKRKILTHMLKIRE